MNQRFKKHVFLGAFLAFFLLGVFLRIYNFNDWLRFNADQGRDAEVVSSFIDGESQLPLLGPRAGGTDFQLGPIFYYFQIISATIFGDAPDKMAYPDLVFGVLCIPLLFFFLRKYFDKKISFSLVAIFVVSAYAIRYSRFAWNPNSAPFWSILALYALHEVLIFQKKNRKFLWSIIAGISIGVGVQLHTTLLLFLPLTAIIIFGYFALKDLKVLKYFLIIVIMSLFLNTTQFIGEYQTKGDNIKAFLGGMEKKQTDVSLIDKLLRNSSCWIQSSADIISGYEISDTCSFKPKKHTDDLLVFIPSFIFVIGGILLAIRSFKKESDSNKKTFLAIVFVYTAIAYLVFIPLAFELSVRFYLVLIFFPFVLAGFWWNFAIEKIGSKAVAIVFFSTALLILCNLFYVKNYFSLLASYKEDGGTVDVVILSQVEDFANFIVENSKESSIETLDGNEKFLFKAFKSIEYLASKSNVELVLLGKEEVSPAKYFYIGRLDRKKELLADKNITVKAHRTHGNFTILLIEKR